MFGISFLYMKGIHGFHVNVSWQCELGTLGGRAKKQAVQNNAGFARTLTVACLCCGSTSLAHRTTMMSEMQAMREYFFLHL